MQGKLSGHTKEDALILAKENGIRKAEAIIRQVAHAVSQFTVIAQKQGVQERWINAVASTLNHHLASWGMRENSKSTISFEIEGRKFADVRLEQTYKGNFHLYAKEENQERKFVIGKNKPEYNLIQNIGIGNLSTQTLCEIVMKYLW